MMSETINSPALPVQSEHSYNNLQTLKRVCVILSVSVCIAIFYISFCSTSTGNKWTYTTILRGNNIFRPATRAFSTVPVVVYWTTYFSAFLSRSLSGSIGCKYKCEYLEKEPYLRISDKSRAKAFIFHARNLNPFDLPVRRSDVNMIFMLKESPLNAGLEYKLIPRDFFNSSMTYRHNSNYPVTYATIQRNKEFTSQTDLTSLQQRVKMLLGKKTSGALMFVSKCETHSRREHYIKELSKHTNISVVSSKCRFKTVQYRNCSRGSVCEKDFIDSHRFYIAFENSDCLGYITEKFYSRMRQGLVPIVRRRIIYESDPQVPPGSFIAADDFLSPKNLALHLEMLVKNDSAYMRYFDWTKKYNVKKEHNDVLCDVCRDIYQNEQLTIPDIQAYFNVDQCFHSA